ncbi:MAG: MFS transporter [Rhodobacteraceae bacterium]|nr:MFS transporter [Paracoccaceae bacterium]MBC8410722.1 MFS transporter [Paracoccaceae bacterium]MBT4778062.1 MFS transporter [Paracoccaceae bacterium]|tara:strand:- start:1082 stop:2296 length:1215 start_codon:yes stop_codon:yes gene_type:complete
MASSTQHDSLYSWLRLAISLMIAIVGNAGMWAIILVLPSVQSEFGIDRASASLPFTLTMLGFALGNFYMGKLADRYNISTVLLFSSIILALCFIFAAQSSSILSLALIQFVIGFGTGASFGPVIADTSIWFLKKRGIAVALAASGNYLSGVVWPIFTRDLLLNYGWRTVYLVLAIAAVLIMAPLSLALKRKISAESTQADDLISQNRAQSTQLSPKSLQLFLGLAGLACCVAMSMPQVHIVAFCVDLGFGSTVGGNMLSLMLAGGIVSRIVSGFLADKIGGLRTLLIGSGLQCIALFLYLPFNGLVSLYLVSLIFGLSQGGIVPSYAIVVREHMPAKEAGARVGFVLMMTIVGMALGGWMSGWIYDLSGSYTLAFWNGILWNLLNLVIIFSLLPKNVRKNLVTS